MSGFYSKIEEIIQSQSFEGLKALEFYYGIDLRIRSIEQSRYSRVHGGDSGRISDFFVEIVGIVVNDDVVPLDNEHAGAFTNGILYTTSQENIEAGAIVEIESGDNRVRRFKVKRKESFGLTRSVFFRYTLSAIGD